MVSEWQVAALPGPVRRSLARAGVLDLPVPEAVVVRQRGRIRSAPDSRWMPFTAKQRYTLDPPSFVWDASLRVAGIRVGRVRDAFEDGHGSMKARVLGLVTILDASGPAMDQGALMRWLNETMWFPAVWATDVITWEPIDEVSALGRVATAGLIAEAEFRFDADGRLVDFRADRYRNTDDGFVMTPWSTPLGGHRRFGQMELPSAGSASWALDDGAFEYVQVTVLDVAYDPAGR